MPFEDIPGLDLSKTELLVVNVDSSGGPMSYDRGDVVVARPGNWPWGRLEDPDERQRMFSLGLSAADPPDKFKIVTVSDLPFDRGRVLDEAWDDDIGGMRSKSRVRVNLDVLPDQNRVERTTALVRSVFRDKPTDRIPEILGI